MGELPGVVSLLGWHIGFGKGCFLGFEVHFGLWALTGGFLTSEVFEWVIWLRVDLFSSGVLFDLGFLWFWGF